MVFSAPATTIVSMLRQPRFVFFAVTLGVAASSACSSEPEEPGPSDVDVAADVQADTADVQVDTPDVEDVSDAPDTDAPDANAPDADAPDADAPDADSLDAEDADSLDAEDADSLDAEDADVWDVEDVEDAEDAEDADAPDVADTDADTSDIDDADIADGDAGESGIASFVVTPDFMREPGDITVRWTTVGATSCTLGTATVPAKPVEVTSSVEVRIVTDTLFVLSCEGEGWRQEGLTAWGLVGLGPREVELLVPEAGQASVRWQTPSDHVCDCVARNGLTAEVVFDSAAEKAELSDEQFDFPYPEWETSSLNLTVSCESALHGATDVTLVRRALTEFDVWTAPASISTPSAAQLCWDAPQMATCDAFHNTIPIGRHGAGACLDVAASPGDTFDVRCFALNLTDSWMVRTTL
jgi:hypothetical protein